MKKKAKCEEIFLNKKKEAERLNNKLKTYHLMQTQIQNKILDDYNRLKSVPSKSINQMKNEIIQIINSIKTINLERTQHKDDDQSAFKDKNSLNNAKLEIVKLQNEIIEVDKKISQKQQEISSLESENLQNNDFENSCKQSLVKNRSSRLLLHTNSIFSYGRKIFEHVKKLGSILLYMCLPSHFSIAIVISANKADLRSLILLNIVYKFFFI